MLDIKALKYKKTNSYFLMAGPCVVESEVNVMQIAEHITSLSDRYHIPFIFKASYRKANRSRMDSFTGIGDQKALQILKKVKDSFDIPVVTDIHETHEAEMAAEYVDMLQIPAFLCRQTNLLVAAARTGKYVNIKKGQFLSADAMQYAVNKVKDAGGDKLLLTERGNSFGYRDLVVDFCGIPVLKSMGVPVVLDVTHSLQQPNQSSGVTGGKPELIETLALSGIASRVDGIFLETHPQPSEAKSDGANMLPLDKLEDLLLKMQKLYQTVHSF